MKLFKYIFKKTINDKLLEDDFELKTIFFSSAFELPLL